MFCSQCGKKLRDGMLFCPFCGAEIVIPEQDEPKAAPEAPVRAPEPEAGPVAPEPPLFPEEADDPAPEVPDVPGAEEDHGPDDRAFPPEPDGAGVIYDVEAPAPPPADTDGDADVPSDWRNAFDDWLEDVPGEAGQAPEPEIRREEPEQPMHHRSAEGEAVPVRRADPPGGASRGRRITGRSRRRPQHAAGAERPGKASLSGGASRDTVVPRRRSAVEDDLFMNGAAPEVLDEYDRYGDDPDDGGFVYEEERPGFFVRHLRSMVGLLLLALLTFVITLYALSGAGQTNLAKLNLAWRPEVYSRLGKESYNVGQFQQAGVYYERALSRAPDNYGYASSAAKCYLDAKNTEKATEMLKKCIALMPTAEDPYVYLQGLYPDPVTRPLEVTQLLEEGYRMTGSERLREAAQGRT